MEINKQSQLPIYDPNRILTKNNLSLFQRNKRKCFIALLMSLLSFIICSIVFVFIYPNNLINAHYNNPAQRSLQTDISDDFLSHLNGAYEEGKLYLHGMLWEMKQNKCKDINSFISTVWQEKYNGFLPMISTVHRVPAPGHEYDSLYGSVKMIFNADDVFLHEVGSDDLGFINPGGFMEQHSQDMYQKDPSEWDFSIHQVGDTAPPNFESEVDRILFTLEKNGNDNNPVPDIAVNSIYESEIDRRYESTSYENMFHINIRDHLEYFTADNPVGAEHYIFGEGVISVDMNKENIAENVPIGITWHPLMAFDIKPIIEFLRGYAEDLRQSIFTNLNIDDVPRNFPIVWLDITDESKRWSLDVPIFEREMNVESVREYIKDVLEKKPTSYDTVFFQIHYAVMQRLKAAKLQDQEANEILTNALQQVNEYNAQNEDKIKVPQH